VRKALTAATVAVTLKPARASPAAVTIPKDFFYSAYRYQGEPVKLSLNSSRPEEAAIFGELFRSVMGIMETEQAVSESVYALSFPGPLSEEKKEENIWLLLLEVFAQNNLSINDSRVIPINEILMKNILNFSVQNNLKLEKIDSYSEKIEDTIAKIIIEYIIKEEILSGKNKEDIDRLFIEILYKKIDKFDNVIKELLKGDFKYNHRFLPSEHEILTNIFDIYNEYLLDEVIEIIEKYKKE